jgi:hypothetical protein
VFEALRGDYRWNSARLHRFVLDGMRSNQAACAAAGVAYHPYVEPAVGAGAGLLEALARRAAVVVADDFPCYFVPRMVASAAREHVACLAEFERAETHDELWNSAQRQLVREGRIHNDLRMLWGKKILQWTHTPRAALDVRIELNNRWALDGRDPNSYGGIFWTLGRYDRPWGPERRVFGTIRSVTSENTARKLDVALCLRRYAAITR